MPKTRPIQVLSADEPWMMIKLADGTILKHRKIIVGVLQLLDDDGNPVINELGMGQYAVQAQEIQIVEHSPMIEERQIDTSNKKVN